MSQADRLLELQRLDSEADVLRERRATLPEREGLRDCEAQGEALARERESLEEHRAGLAREERRLENEVADVGSKAMDVETTLYSGKVTAVSELEGLQLELDSFRRRQAALEEEELAVMERVETADGELALLGARRGDLDARVGELGAALAAAEAELDAALAVLAEQRAAVVPDLAGELLSTYDHLRGMPRLEGKVTAPFRDGTCIGCRVKLPITEATRIRRAPPDELAQCPRCHRLLVR